MTVDEDFPLVLRRVAAVVRAECLDKPLSHYMVGAGG
jgi:hypothetical protein